MEITDVKFRKVFSEGKLVALVSVVINGIFAVHDIKIIRGAERLFVAMPSRKDENGVFRDVAHPINKEFRALLENEILKRYELEYADEAVQS